MNACLLVLALVVSEIRVLLQRLADSRDTSVAEDAPRAMKEPKFASVTFDILLSEECKQGLRHGQSLCSHQFILFSFSISRVTRGTLGSLSRQVSRTQTNWGSSEAAMDRADPASTFR